ncbi:MAG: tetratricopeptide repeat protein, partial [Deltaproteobacteria bacterium]|nr:tetratricopeptide repeat protein [Deltaproteobacteria bacterium]
DVAGAVVALREAVMIEGTTGKSAARLRKLLGDRSEWAEYATVLRDYVARPTVAGDRSRAELELATVLEQRLGRIDDAIATLKRAVRTAAEMPAPSVPEVLALRTALANALRRGGRVDDAIAENRKILATDPAAVTSVRELRGLFESRGRNDEAACADAVLVALGGAEPQNAQNHRERSMRPLTRRASPLDVASIRELATDPAERIPAAELLAAVSDHLARVYPPDLERLGLSSRDRIGPRDRHAMRALADQVAATLGVSEYALFIHQVRGRGVVIENDDPLAICVPASLAEASDREQTFALARAFCKVATKHYLVEKLTPRELEVLLAACARMVAPGVGSGLTAEDFLEDLTKRIQKALPRKARPVVSEAATRYVSSPRADFVKLVRAIDRTAVRVASVMADDLPAALAHLAKTDRDVQTALAQAGKVEAPMHEMVRVADALTDPVRWFLSDECFALRRRLWG